ncbi:MAG: ester cyclase [Rhodospirillaceae bacterium]|nr:ester cyclase [Rhodospirillaceae bacterium]
MKNVLMSALAAAAFAVPALAAETTTLVGCAPDNPYFKAYMGMTNEMFIPRDGMVAKKFYADEFISHNQDRGGGTATKINVSRMEHLYEESFKTFGKRTYENEVIICSENYVIARVAMESTMTGPMGDQPATGKTARISATDIYKFGKDAKVIERWGNADNVGQLWQLGLKLPPPPPGMGGAEAPKKDEKK